MVCPRCAAAREEGRLECGACGVIFEKWEILKPIQTAAPPPANPRTVIEFARRRSAMLLLFVLASCTAIAFVIGNMITGSNAAGVIAIFSMFAPVAFAFAIYRCPSCNSVLLNGWAVILSPQKCFACGAVLRRERARGIREMQSIGDRYRARRTAAQRLSYLFWGVLIGGFVLPSSSRFSSWLPEGGEIWYFVALAALVGSLGIAKYTTYRCPGCHVPISRDFALSLLIPELEGCPECGIDYW
jgi:hypothetical protein